MRSESRRTSVRLYCFDSFDLDVVKAVFHNDSSSSSRTGEAAGFWVGKTTDDVLRSGLKTHGNTALRISGIDHLGSVHHGKSKCFTILI